MKRLLTGRYLMAMAMVLALGLGWLSGCKQKDHNPVHAPQPFNLRPGGGGVPTLDQCMDKLDNDYDKKADRYGVPAHCTIGIVKQTTNRGSRTIFTADGEYNDPDPDVYTIRVVGGGGSGVAQITATSSLGNNSPTNNIITEGRPIWVGSHGLVIWFNKDKGGVLNLVAGETWKVSGQDYVTNCYMRPDQACLVPDAITEGISSIQKATQCNDGIDNNHNGFTDYTGILPEPNCQWNCSATIVQDKNWISEWYPYTPQCNDGIDNDNDGLIDDLADPDCNHNNCVPFE